MIEGTLKDVLHRYTDFLTDTSLTGIRENISRTGVSFSFPSWFRHDLLRVVHELWLACDHSMVGSGFAVPIGWYTGLKPNLGSGRCSWPRIHRQRSRSPAIMVFALRGFGVVRRRGRFGRWAGRWRFPLAPCHAT